MSIQHSTEPHNERELLYFWAIGDMHYRTLPMWQSIHTQRFKHMFDDLHELWQAEGKPAFCVSPGDLVETGALENYRLAQAELTAQLGDIPFYAGTGNHEFFRFNMDPTENAIDNYRAVWGRPLRYTWTTDTIHCIMLDYPDPYTLEDERFLYISQETLTYLDNALMEHTDRPALIFLHCPLRNTVLDRDSERHRDYNSTQSFFSPENSQEVRSILARHNHACLYFSGHTHSGWEAPNIVCTEQLGDHPITFVNLMSPWYTGTHTGPRVSEGGAVVNYVPDDPNVIATFAVRVYQDRAVIRLRDHMSKQWLKSWTVNH